MAVNFQVAYPISSLTSIRRRFSRAVNITSLAKGMVEVNAVSCVKPGNGTGLLSAMKWISILFLMLLIACDGMPRSEVFNIKDPQKATQKLLQLSGSPSAELVEIQHLIDHGADVNAVHKSGGGTSLHRASENGCLQTVAALLKADANMNAKGFLGYTPLHAAIYYDQTDVVSILVDAKADVNAVNDKGETPLFLAAMSGNVQIANLLIEANADVEAATIGTGEAPIHQAALSGHTQIINLLLEANANVNAVADGGLTALHRAITHGETESVKALLNGNADVNLANERGETPLHNAAWDYFEIVPLLLDAGAHVNVSENESGNTPLHLAVWGDNPNIVEALLKAGADVNAKNKRGSTPLHFASSPVTATALLKVKAKVNAVDSLGRTPLHQAAASGSDQVVHTLLDADANVNIASDSGTPLFLAAHGGHAQTVDALIEAGADVNAADKKGTTPLIVASSNGYGTIVAALLEAGANADVEAVDAGGNIITTALRIAKEKHHNDIAALLNIQSKIKFGKAFFQAAATLRLKDLINTLNANDSEKLTRLLKEGADANIRNQFGETPLCAAARGGYIQMVDSLISANADVNAGCPVLTRNTPHLNGDESLAELLSALAEMTNNLAHPTVIENFTPLHWSASNGDKQIVAALLKARADANAKAYYGKVVCTPLNVAEKNGHVDIVELLKSHGVQNTNSGQ
jgi:ankyrin repeat protein